MKDKINLTLDTEVKKLLILKAKKLGLKPSQYVTLWVNGVLKD